MAKHQQTQSPGNNDIFDRIVGIPYYSTCLLLLFIAKSSNLQKYYSLINLRNLFEYFTHGENTSNVDNCVIPWFFLTHCHQIYHCLLLVVCSNLWHVVRYDAYRKQLFKIIHCCKGTYRLKFPLVFKVTSHAWVTLSGNIFPSNSCWILCH